MSINEFMDSMSSKLNYKTLSYVNIDKLKQKLNNNNNQPSDKYDKIVNLFNDEEKKILTDKSDVVYDENIQKIINIYKKINSSLNNDNDIIKFINILLNCSIYYSLKYEILFLNILNILKLLRLLTFKKYENKQNNVHTFRLKIIRRILHIFKYKINYDTNILKYLENKYPNDTSNIEVNNNSYIINNRVNTKSTKIIKQYIDNIKLLHRINYNMDEVKELNNYLYYKPNESNPLPNKSNSQPNESNPKYVLDYNIFEYNYNKSVIPSIQ